jgi:hypothetical protein
MVKEGEKLGNDGDSPEAAWSRFERAVDGAVKSGPKHRATPKAKDRPRARDASKKARRDASGIPAFSAGE